MRTSYDYNIAIGDRPHDVTSDARGGRRGKFPDWPMIDDVIEVTIYRLAHLPGVLRPMAHARRVDACQQPRMRNSANISRGVDRGAPSG